MHNGFFTPFNFFTLCQSNLYTTFPVLFTKLSLANCRMRENKTFCIYCCFSVSRYIYARYIFKHNWIFRYLCIYKQPILTNSWIKILLCKYYVCRYFRYTGRLFLGCVLFVARWNIIRPSWKPRMKDSVTEKST